ncbi:MAG: cell division protein FtsQ [Bacteroidaceae bacterium]|jgi:cell division protein FtsQ|nr:cell division protein FtsQ [Bacteroidaceae bacterium]
MTKTGKILKVVGMITLFLGIVGYLAYYMLIQSETDSESPCVAVELNMEDDVDAQFISQKDVENILSKSEWNPVGKNMKGVNAAGIESLVAENPFVKEVNCYKSTKGKVIVSVKQRTPLIYIIPNDTVGYFLDETATIIPTSKYVKNIVVASGDIDYKYASTELLEFAVFLEKNKFWNDQIEQIYISRDDKNKRFVELVPRVGDQLIFLGTLNDFETKLERLKIFYEKVMGTVGWNKYSRINLEYENQIICTKHKK